MEEKTATRTNRDVVRQARQRRLDPRRKRRKILSPEAAKEKLTERQKWNRWCNGELHTLPASRRAWAKKSFDDLVARGVIEAWAWAPEEREFIEPMTKPALGEDQRVVVLYRFFKWDEQQPVEGAGSQDRGRRLRKEFMS